MRIRLNPILMLQFISASYETKKSSSSATTDLLLSITDLDRQSNAFLNSDAEFCVVRIFLNPHSLAIIITLLSLSH